MRAGLVYFRPTSVAFIRAGGVDCPTPREAWARLAACVAKNGLKPAITAAYGLKLVAGSSDKRERYDACISFTPGFVLAGTSELSRQMLAGGAFARMRHVGLYRNAALSLRHIAQDWLPQHVDLELDRRRNAMMIFLDDPADRAPHLLRCDVCLPVRTRYDEAFVRPKLARAA